MKIIWYGFQFWNKWAVNVLILTRKVNDSIMIDDNIEIIVVDIKGDQVKLGIKAPKNISVHRTEVFLEIQNQNIKAVESSPESLKNLKDLLDKKKNK